MFVDRGRREHVVGRFHGWRFETIVARERWRGFASADQGFDELDAENDFSGGEGCGCHERNGSRGQTGEFLTGHRRGEKVSRLIDFARVGQRRFVSERRLI